MNTLGALPGGILALLLWSSAATAQVTGNPSVSSPTATVERAASQPPNDRLEYLREAEASGCPDAIELREAVIARMGRDPFLSHGLPRLLVDVGPGDPGQLVATLRRVEPNGLVSQRSELKAPAEDCAELIASVAIAIMGTRGK